MRNSLRIPVLAVLAFLAWPGGRAHAQVPTSLPDQAPFTFGRVQLFPLYSVDLDWTDNLYYQPKDSPDRISTASASVAPGFVLDMPFSQSHSRIGYVLNYHGYETHALPANTTHYFVGETDLQFSNGFRLGLRDDFERGVLNTQVFDPGGAITFRGDAFQGNNAAISVGYERENSRLLELSINNNRFKFVGQGQSSYFDVDEVGADLLGEHQLGPRLRLHWELGYSRSELSRPAAGGSSADDRTQINQSWKLGGLWTLGPGSSLQVKAGGEQSETRSAFPSRSDSLTGSLSYLRGVPGGTQLRLDLTRDIYPATFGHNNVYLTNRFSVTVNNDVRARLVLGTVWTYYTNDFPAPIQVPPDDIVDTPYQGRTRKDRAIDGEAWVGYRFGRFAVARLYVRARHRSSVVSRFDYDVKTVGATIGLGS